MKFQIIVNNTALDLNDNTSLSFKFVNDVFGFDKIELSRTTEFDVPTTPRNQSIFEFAERVDLTGGAMRVINNAYLNYSGGQIVGKLSISYATPTNYKCCFVYGEMQALADIKAAGNIGEYLNFPSSDNVALPTYPTKPTPIDYNSNLNFPLYDNGLGEAYEVRMPAVKLSYLLYECATYFGVTYSSAINSMANVLRIVLNTLNAEDFAISTKTMTITAGSTPNISGYDANYFTTATLTFDTRGGDFETIKVYKCIAPCKLRVTGTNTQTSGHPAWQFQRRTIYQVRMSQGSGKGLDLLMSSVVKESSDTNLDVTFELQRGDFVFFADYCLDRDWLDRTYYTPKSTWALSVLSFTLEVLGASETTQMGGTFYLQPNLPEVTFLDLLKVVAQASCRALVYDSATKKFDAFNWDFDNAGGEVRRLEDSLVKITKIERNFIDFAQSNAVVFDNNDFITSADRLKAERYYQVPNLNLDKSKTIFTMPFSQGAVTTINTTFTERNIARINCVKLDENGNRVFDNPSKPTLLVTGAYQATIDFGVLTSITNPNEYLQNICTLSTKIEAEAVMSEREFLNTTRYTTYTYSGGKYAVIDAEWSGGVAKLKLQRYK